MNSILCQKGRGLSQHVINDLFVFPGVGIKVQMLFSLEYFPSAVPEGTVQCLFVDGVVQKLEDFTQLMSGVVDQPLILYNM